MVYKDLDKDTQKLLSLQRVRFLHWESAQLKEQRKNQIDSPLTLVLLPSLQALMTLGKSMMNF